MKCKKVIGLTGSIATGKSTAANILRKLGYEVIDSDKLGHLLMEPGQANYLGIVEEFGQEILLDDSSINRPMLSQIVFSDKSKLEKLNKITHHNIFTQINGIIQKSKNIIIFVELPILVELKLEDKLSIDFDEIWLVYVSQKMQMKRLMERNNFTSDQALDRIKSQLSVEVKKAHADFIIFNDKDISHMEKQIKDRLKVYESIT